MPRSVPADRHRTRYDQAIVTLRDSVTRQARDDWLGPYDSPRSRELYHRLIAEWEASGRRLVEPLPLIGRCHDGRELVKIVTTSGDNHRGTAAPRGAAPPSRRFVVPDLTHVPAPPASDPARDMAMYSALLGHAPTIDPNCPPPTDLTGEPIATARPWMRRLADGWRYQASRPTWLGELLSGIEHRLREGFARVQETPRESVVEQNVDEAEARPAMRYRVAA